MKVVLYGASGMVGQGVLRECLLDADVESVVAISRSATGKQHPKFIELVLPDPGNLSSVEERLRGYDTCFFCVGVSSAGMSQADYRRVTYDLTLRVARTLARHNPEMTFVYISAMGADSTTRGRVMWARVRGETENALFALPFKGVYALRPGLIQPLHGITSRTAAYRFFYAVLAPLIPLVLRLFPNQATTTERLGRAMLQVAKSGAPKQVLETRDFNALS